MTKPTKQAHTPTLGKLTVKKEGAVFVVYEESPLLPGRFDHPVLKTIDEANAEFIVKAVNNYQPMLDWLKKEYARCAPLSNHGKELTVLISQAEGGA